MTPSKPRRTGFVWSERFLWHDTGTHALYQPAGEYTEPLRHVDSPEPKRRMYSLLEVSGLLSHLERLEPRAATRDELLRFHSHDYLDELCSLRTLGGGDAGARSGFVTPLGAASFAGGPGGNDLPYVPLLATGAVLVAAEAVYERTVQNAYALVRPPGHHATCNSGMGFCIFANVVIAIEHLRAIYDIDRVAVVDWDVHHGNGTEDAFWSDPGVLTLSIHQEGAFPPGRGSLSDNGEGAGDGYNINVPLPPGSGTGAYLEVFKHVVLPALDAFEPQIIFVACGFDAAAYDPLGQMLLHSECYRELTRLLMNAADRHCEGRLVFSQEGGYSAAQTPFCGLAVIEELAGHRTSVEDPFLLSVSSLGGQELQPHQRERISESAALVARLVEQLGS